MPCSSSSDFGCYAKEDYSGHILRPRRSSRQAGCPHTDGLTALPSPHFERGTLMC